MTEGNISIIIPCFNAASTLKRALQSAISQTDIQKEIILIDGGSTDGSLQIIDQLKSDINYFVSEPDSGVYAAINKGIKQSTGEWIYILGADDYLSSPTILSQLLHPTDDRADIIFGNVVNENVGHALVPKVFVSHFDQSLLWRNTLHQQSVLYRRTLFTKCMFNEKYRVLADYDFHLKLLKSNIRSCYQPLEVAYCEASGLSKQFDRKLYLEELEIKKQLNIVPRMINYLWIPIKYLVKKLF